MKILLVNPTHLDACGQPVKYRKAYMPPLALAVLDGLTPVRHTVRIIDDAVESIDFSAPYSLVGISAMTSQIDRAYQIADRFRERNVPVVIGGTHASLVPEEVKRHADSVVIGEAEDIWEQLLADCENNQPRVEYRQASYTDLSLRRLPRWDHMNMKLYPRPLMHRLPMIPIYTSRGCPMGCQFCAVHKIHGKSYRTKPIQNILTEMDALPTKSYFFVDDNIAFNPDYSRELFAAIAGRNVLWMSQVSTTILKSPDLIDLAARAGCTYLFIGMESINQNSLGSVNKGFNQVEQYEELIQRLQRAGIVPYLSFIFGFDEDTPDQFEQTLAFLRKNKIVFATLWILTPIPGTALHDRFRKEKRLDPDAPWSAYDGVHMVFRPSHVSGKELVAAYWKTYQSFYGLKNLPYQIFTGLRFSADDLLRFAERLFYLAYFRKKVYSREHPLSGGIGRRMTGT